MYRKKNRLILQSLWGEGPCHGACTIQFYNLNVWVGRYMYLPYKLNSFGQIGDYLCSRGRAGVVLTPSACHIGCCGLVNCFNPLSPHDALKHHLSSLKNDLILWNLAVWSEFFYETVLKITVFFFICHPLQVIFIHYKSRIATAIRGSEWMKMTIVNSGLKGLKKHFPYTHWKRIRIVGYLPDREVACPALDR